MNRLLGTLFAVATLVTCVFAILNAGKYSSMCRCTAAETAKAAETAETAEVTEAVDSLFLDTELLNADLTPVLEE